jgi:hypothetical protein
MVSGIAKTYFLRVRCPYCDFDDWITLHNRTESLDQLCAAPCDFECPTHGAQQGFPLEGVEKGAATRAAQHQAALLSPAAAKKSNRSSERNIFPSWSSMAGANLRFFPRRLITLFPPVARWLSSPLLSISAKTISSQ